MPTPAITEGATPKPAEGGGVELGAVKIERRATEESMFAREKARHHSAGSDLGSVRAADFGQGLAHAAELYDKAVTKQDAEAQYAIGEFYFKGSAAEEKAKAERRAARPRTPGHAYPVAERKGPPGERKASSAPGSPRVPSYDSTIDMNLDAAREALEAVGEEEDASALRRRHVPPFSLKD